MAGAAVKGGEPAAFTLTYCYRAADQDSLGRPHPRVGRPPRKQNVKRRRTKPNVNNEAANNSSAIAPEFGNVDIAEDWMDSVLNLSHAEFVRRAALHVETHWSKAQAPKVAPAKMPPFGLSGTPAPVPTHTYFSLGYHMAKWPVSAMRLHVRRLFGLANNVSSGPERFRYILNVAPGTKFPAHQRHDAAYRTLLHEYWKNRAALDEAEHASPQIKIADPFSPELAWNDRAHSDSCSATRCT